MCSHSHSSYLAVRFCMSHVFSFPLIIFSCSFLYVTICFSFPQTYLAVRSYISHVFSFPQTYLAVRSCRSHVFSFPLIIFSCSLLYITCVLIPTHHLQLLGPMADNTNQLFGDYAPNTSPAYKTTPLDGLRQLFSVKHETVCSDGTPCSQYKQETVKGLVPGADLLFVALGTGERDGTFVYLGKRMQWVFENASRWNYYVVAVVLDFFFNLLQFCFGYLFVCWVFFSFYASRTNV